MSSGAIVRACYADRRVAQLASLVRTAPSRCVAIPQSLATLAARSGTHAATQCATTIESNNMRRVTLIPAVAAVSTALLTGFIIMIGPESTKVVELTDRLVLLGWWFLAIGMALGGAWIARRGRNDQARKVRNGPPSWLAALLGVGSIGIIASSVTWDHDVTNQWPGITTLWLIVGLLFAWVVFHIWSSSRSLAAASSLIVVGIVFSYALPALLQLPGTIRSAYDFAFTSDELAAVAAGHFPLSDYIPQYSNLLGLPIAPALHLLGARAIYGVVAWLVFLQLVSLAVSVALPTLIGGWKILAPAMVVAVMPVLSTIEVAPTPTGYFAVTPMRIVLPSLTILFAFLVLRDRRSIRTDGRHFRRLFALGVTAGLTMLNNTDYGIPAALTILVVIVIVSSSARLKVLSVIVYFFGAVAPFAVYSLAGQVFSRPVDWSYWVLFPRVFGVEGFSFTPMDPFGLHIAFVSLFISASVIGFILMVRYRDQGSRFAYQQGLYLAFVGGWSLLSLAYFSGRSYTPVLVTGYAFMAGMVVAAFLPLLRLTFRRLRTSGESVQLDLAVSFGLGVLAIAAAASTFMLAPRPTESFATIASVPPGRFEPLMQQTANLEGVLSSPAGAELRRLVDEGRVEQALPMSSLTGLVTGIRSDSVATNPVYYDISPVFSQIQCARSWADGTDYLLVAREAANSFAQEPLCDSHFDFAHQRSFESGPYTFVLLPRSTERQSAAD